VRKRLVAAAIAATALAFAGATAHADGRHAINLVEAHPDLQPTFVDTGTPGLSVGDVAIHRDQVNRPNGASAGTITQVCTLVELGSNPFTSTYECSGSIALKNGTITMAGPFVPAQPEATAAITGGTGDYRGARGEIVVRAEADQIVVKL
jgi:hypothetical protein